MIGMFSLFDALFGAPIEEILKDIDFHIDVKDALLKREGVFGKMLELAIAIDEENFLNVKTYLEDLNLDELAKVIKTAEKSPGLVGVGAH